MTPLVLVILDGWGIAPDSKGNAISLARTPMFDGLWSKYPHAQLEASGPAVGLPPGEEGNSEVGHLNLGGGRIVYQELPKINIQIADGDFFRNEVLIKAVNFTKEQHSSLHLLGLIGPGTVHSSQDHLLALLKLAKQEGLEQDQVKLHLFTDGRDSPTDNSPIAVNKVAEAIEHYGIGVICSISGRYYAMDRNKRWERTAKAYQTITSGLGEKATDVQQAITQSYQKKIYDEHILPTIITFPDGKPKGIIQENDAVIFFNYRADRAVQLTQAFVLDDFIGFERPPKIRNLYYVTLTEYDDDLPVSAIAYPRDNIKMGLAETISQQGLRQFHIAETEKYAHVTYFFNGRREEPFSGEERLLIPSPKVATYDQQPEMSATEITKTVIEKLQDGAFQFILINYANGDMVAHTGNIEATIKAIEHLDTCLAQLVPKILAVGGTCLLTADHGNAEEMLVHGLFRAHMDTKHSINPVPFILVSANENIHKQNLNNGVLADVAPTILYLMDLAQPMEMTGKVLFI